MLAPSWGDSRESNIGGEAIARLEGSHVGVYVRLMLA